MRPGPGPWVSPQQQQQQQQQQLLCSRQKEREGALLVDRWLGNPNKPTDYKEETQ